MTKIFNSYSKFLSRENYDDNGVSKQFAEDHENWEQMNETNKACWDCSDCSDCSGLRRKDNIKGEENKDVPNKIAGFPNVPVIENIHQKLYAAIKPNGHNNKLDMSSWHTCDTTHCRAGWITVLAGQEGKELEEKTSTQFAAMQIYKASSPIKVSPPRFFETNEVAMADIIRCAEEEKKLNQ